MKQCILQQRFSFLRQLVGKLRIFIKYLFFFFLVNHLLYYEYFNFAQSTEDHTGFIASFFFFANSFPVVPIFIGYAHRPFRLPGILVGDGRLGGISGTISAYESLKLRGYDIVAVVFEDHGLVNEIPLLSYLRNR